MSSPNPIESQSPAKPLVVVEVTDDFESCLYIRKVVFVDEQKVPLEEEIDGLDDQAVHLIAKVDGTPVGTARLMRVGEAGKIGRVCVLVDHRKHGVGGAIMRYAISHFSSQPDCTIVKLSAQTCALAFYEKLGFVAYGPEYMDAGIPHLDMSLSLKANASPGE